MDLYRAAFRYDQEIVVNIKIKVYNKIKKIKSQI